MYRKFSTIVLLLFGAVYISCREVPSPPRIVKQPPTDEVLFQVQEDENYKPFFIECEAIGEPAPRYKWMKNGKPFVYQTYDNRIIQQPGRGTLTITKPNNEDLGQYQCFAENEYGIATSNSVFMRKAELNNFKNSNIGKSVVGNEGEPFKLECQPPDGWPKPRVYWMKFYVSERFETINDERKTVDPEGNLWFSNLTRQDATETFTYACGASSVVKHEHKFGGKIKLQVKPTGVSTTENKHAPVRQYVSRKNEVAIRGKNIELFCIYGGTPLPQFVWTKDGVNINFNDRISAGSFGKSLIIKLVDFEDKGSYSCSVTNGVGAETYSINLDVQAIPYFTEEPMIIHAAEGETVEFRCAASGFPTPEIKWIHNGLPIAEAKPNTRRIVNSNSIIIEHLKKEDTGNYGCNATNSLGYVYKDVYVNVLALAPEITEAPQDVEAVDGTSINITCRVFGAPKPQVKWIKNGEELTGGKYKVLENGDLFISNVQSDDRGDYRCYAENKFGDAKADCKFTVRRHTYISDGPEDYEVAAGVPATFRCNAIADEDLELEILWLKNGVQIDFESEARFIKTSDYSLTITKTIEIDSANYTCIARTRLDEASAQAQLTVQDVPNAPLMKNVKCNSLDATIEWEGTGDNRAGIQRYIIQYNTSFTPDTWEVASDTVPAAQSKYNVAMSPWANYTFRVIAVNKIGLSIPSLPSGVCTTEADVPHKNPDNVEGEGDQPDNLVIRWTPMPEIEHNGPEFQYVVSYKLDISGEEFREVEVNDWRRNYIVIPNQESFKRYKITVVAKNREGEADVSPKEVTGYSGEDKPSLAPTNFTVENIQSATAALLSWNPVPRDSVHGHLKGYKIRTWTDNSPTPHEIQIQEAATKALVTIFVPFSRNYAQVYVYNGKFNGPRSETLTFDTPEGVPGQMSSLEAYPMGSSAFLLVWQKPDQPNGILTGYKISYAVVDGTAVGTKVNRNPQINDPNILQAKLAGLNSNVKYRIYISATTAAGDSKEYFIERTTRAQDSLLPYTPKFTWSKEPTVGNYGSIRVKWLPNYDRPGSHFFVKYRKVGEVEYRHTNDELKEDWIVVNSLEPGEVYEIIVVAVDGTHMAVSETQTVDMGSSGEAVIIQRRENVATAGWFIGMMLAIAFLLLVLIIVCIVKRNRGGKYAVHEREQANGRHDYPDEGGFHEYSQPLDNKSHGRASMSSEPRLEAGSDTDSMAEYGEGDTEGMNEDGSFIGQYGRQRRQGETTSQGFTTLV